MTELTDPSLVRPRRRFWLELILLLCFLTCLVVGAASLATLLWLRTANPVTQSADSTLPVVQRTEISPRLTLNQLAGDPEGALALQAIQAGEFESAWSIMAYATTIDDEAMGALLQLFIRRISSGERLDTSSRSRFIKVLRDARSLAVLSANLDMTARAQLLSQGTLALIELGEREEALQSALQLQQLAQKAPDLLPAQRSQLLEPLLAAVPLLDDRAFQQRLMELTRNPFVTPVGGLLTSRLEDLAVPIEEAEAVRAASVGRQQASLNLIRGLQGLDNRLADQAVLEGQLQAERDALAQTLLNEDQVRRQATQQGISENSDPRIRLTMLRGLYDWTLLKARIARGGFGLSIVPAWESDQPTIQQEIDIITRDIDGAIEEIMDTMEIPQEKAGIRVEKFLWLARSIDRGLYPSGSPPLIGTELSFAQDELANQGIPLALRVFYDTAAISPGFLFTP